MTTLAIFGLCLIIVLINIPRMARHSREEHERYYECREGKFSGQVRPIDDWRKIAIELARTTKNSSLALSMKYGTDEDVIGLLYTNFGINLFDI